MPTDLIECREYILTPLGDDQAVYTLYDCTLHPSEEGAHQWVAHQVRQHGTGEGITTEVGHLPGKAWTTAPVQAVEFAVSAGTDIEAASMYLPDHNYEEGGLDEEYNSDEPLPPDDH
jgi:hypothetical protein